MAPVLKIVLLIAWTGLGCWIFWGKSTSKSTGETNPSNAVDVTQKASSGERGTVYQAGRDIINNFGLPESTVRELIKPVKQKLASMNVRATIETTGNKAPAVNIFFSPPMGLGLAKMGKPLIFAFTRTGTGSGDDRKQRVVYAATESPEHSPALGQEMSVLAEADSFQITSPEFRSGSMVLTGIVTVVLNGSVKFELQIPPQTIRTGTNNMSTIYIKDLTEMQKALE